MVIFVCNLWFYKVFLTGLSWFYLVIVREIVLDKWREVDFSTGSFKLGKLF